MCYTVMAKKTYFQYGSHVPFLVFKILNFDEMSLFEVRICVSVPHFIKIDWLILIKIHFVVLTLCRNFTLIGFVFCLTVLTSDLSQYTSKHIHKKSSSNYWKLSARCGQEPAIVTGQAPWILKDDRQRFLQKVSKKQFRTVYYNANACG